MELSITLASQFEITNYAELIEQTCAFVQGELRSASLPQLPVFTLWLENGNHFTGIPLRVIGKESNKMVTMITSDPIERPISTIFIPFIKIQSIQVAQSESILSILLKRQQAAQTSYKLVTLTSIRNNFEVKWLEVASKHKLLPYVYFNWDEVGNSEFEKQNIVSISSALIKAIDVVVRSESKKNTFNKLQTLQISNAPVKDIQLERQGAFLYLNANFLRAPSLNLEKELVVLLTDILN